VLGHHLPEMNFNWETFYDCKAGELILYGRALGLGHGEAEDVLQETFLAMVRLPQLPREPEHYCLRSFRNRALNYKRSLWRSLRTITFLRVFEESHWFEKSPDETAAEQSLQTDALRSLAELPQEQREAIVLKIWHGCTFEEIGDLLEISPNTAAGRYRYGLQKLKLQLEGINDERIRNEIIGGPIAFLASATSFGDA
jgi:RNA polymerase sigma-70 factor (ECF subfamily)